MAIDLTQLIQPERKELIKQIAQTLDETIPAIQKLVDDGLPFDTHLTKYKEKRAWIAKFERLFLNQN